jgi:hypothetical protein
MSEEKSHTNLLPLVPEASDNRKSSYQLTQPVDSVKYKFEMNQIDGSEPYVKF